MSLVLHIWTEEQYDDANEQQSLFAGFLMHASTLYDIHTALRTYIEVI